MINDVFDNFIVAYRNASRDKLDRQYDDAMQNLEQSRRNAYRSIMSTANNTGTMYSEFPKRDKEIYMANTYNPTFAKIRDTYQTGLNKLRENSVNLYNNIAKLNADTNALLDKPGEASEWGRKDPVVDEGGNVIGYNYYDNEGKPVKFYTYAIHNPGNYDLSQPEQLYKYMKEYLPANEWDSIYAMLQAGPKDNEGFANSYLQWQKNTGKDYTGEWERPSWMTPEWYDLMNRLGLRY